MDIIKKKDTFLISMERLLILRLVIVLHLSGFCLNIIQRSIRPLTMSVLREDQLLRYFKN